MTFSALRRPRAALAILAAVLSCGGDHSAPDSQGDTPWEPCPSGFHDDCRSIVLPLDYDAPDGTKVPVFVSRAKSFTPSQADLWLLQGGPGYSAEVFDTVIDEIRHDVPGVDVYTMEQRGVGESARLGCPDQESPSSDQGTTISHAEVPACLAAVEARWPGGLKDFRLTPAANDLAHVIDVTRTPGRPVFVYGVSYGTAVAIRYMQLRPNDAAGIILDSIAPPGIAFFSHFSEQYDPVLHSLASLCAADSNCVAHLGTDPWTALSAVSGDLVDGGCAPAKLTRNSLGDDLETMLQSDLLRVGGMALLHRLNRCDAADLPAIDALKNYIAATRSTRPQEPLRSSTGMSCSPISGSRRRRVWRSSKNAAMRWRSAAAARSISAKCGRCGRAFRPTRSRLNRRLRRAARCC